MTQATRPAGAVDGGAHRDPTIGDAIMSEPFCEDLAGGHRRPFPHVRRFATRRQDLATNGCDTAPSPAGSAP